MVAVLTAEPQVPRARPAMALERQTFATSRLMEYFAAKELQMQIGHSPGWWPLALTKELVDNALDAAEAAGVSPAIAVEVDGEAHTVTVRDNGAGLPVATLERSLDYAVRVSDKAYYVSPTRGQLGNALKCVWAAPFVLDGERGRVEVAIGGQTHVIDVTLDRIAQRPHLQHTVSADPLVKTGTLVRIHWPEQASLAPDPRGGDCYNALIHRYAAFNPHASFAVRTTSGRDGRGECPASSPAWTKWLPTSPTSPHWYTTETLRALIGASIAAERDGGRAQTVREFVASFDGLRGTAKQKAVTEAAGLSGACLHDLVVAERGDIAGDPVRRLLAAMRQQARPVKPAALGVIGADHLKAWLVGERVGAASVRYKRVEGEAAGVPFVVEVALGVYAGEYANHWPRRVVVGVNWSPALPAGRLPIAELESLLGGRRVDVWDPVVVVVHVATPQPGMTDRGKTTVTLPEPVVDGVRQAIEVVTREWLTAKRQADREGRLRERELEQLRKADKRDSLSVKDAAYQVMEAAYRKASGTVGLAGARQIMYAARGPIQELTGGAIWKNDQYFTQQLLPDFMEAYPELTAGWDVVFDARGHLAEPHTGEKLGIGTLEVRRYVGQWTAAGGKDDAETLPLLDYSWPTCGPEHRYGFALFIEKEGFAPLLERLRIGDRFDVAILSSKGMSTTAARDLVEELSRKGVTMLVLRDFDKSGFSIAHTLGSDSRRKAFRERPRIVDLGLRLADVEAMGLPTEAVTYDSTVDPRIRLRATGATEAECRFLVSGGHPGHWTGSRVELNAMTSDQFRDWLERKLKDAGVRKVVPGDDVLAAAYRRAVRLAAIEKAMLAAAVRYHQENAGLAIPADLRTTVEHMLAANAALAWDAAVAQLVDGEESHPC